VGKSDKLISMRRSLTINRDGGFLRISSKISLSLKKRAAQIKTLLMGRLINRETRGKILETRVPPGNDCPMKKGK
jgi:hypothetical protein